MFVGIDIGGTKTHVLAADGDDVVLDRVLPTREWQHNGLLDDERSVESLLSTFAALGDSSHSAVVIGAHGLDTRAQVRDFERALRGQHRGPIRAVNDVELLGPAAGFTEAIAVVAGTGSKIVAHAADGSMITAGGYGHLLGDPGSAAALAREGMRAVLDARDAGAEPDVLAQQLMRHFSVADVEAAANSFAEDSRLAAWASMAPMVFRAADHGSTLAEVVIDDAARELARSVANVVARGAVSSDVVCAGGVITNQPRLYDAFSRHVGALTPDLTVHLLDVPPLLELLRLRATATVRTIT
ncbi:BadF/BadG/BcrA/BcrD ATPase family protein [Streptomyces sp. L7]|uniref:BadF/BadG/BcrA/BcrD ATPase family protein n=1 Tax=Streptomyces sp. L7 TaxID=3423954 RepID=UPI003D9864EB